MKSVTGQGPVIRLAIITAAIVVFAAVAFFVVQFFSGDEGPEEITENHIVVQEIKDLGRLELVSFRLKDVVTKKIVNDYWYDSEVLLIIAGEVIGCIDLADFSEDQLERRGDTLVVRLPEPQICVFKVDHQNTRVYDSDFTLLDYIHDRHGDILQNTFRDAELAILRAAREQGIYEKVNENAIRFFKGFFKTLGYNFVEVVPSKSTKKSVEEVRAYARDASAM